MCALSTVVDDVEKQLLIPITCTRGKVFRWDRQWHAEGIGLGTLCVWGTKRSAYLPTQGVTRSNLKSHYQTEQRWPKNEDKSELPVHAPTPTRCVPGYSRLGTRWARSREQSDAFRSRRDRSCCQRDPRDVSHVRNCACGQKFAGVRAARKSRRNVFRILRELQGRCSVS